MRAGHQVPSLENWGSGLKSLLWLANSPHTPSVYLHQFQYFTYTHQQTPVSDFHKVTLPISFSFTDSFHRFISLLRIQMSMSVMVTITAMVQLCCTVTTQSGAITAPVLVATSILMLQSSV